MQNFRCVLATDLHPVRMTRAPLQPTCAQRTHSVSFLQFFPWSLALQTAYLARAWSVRGPCLLRTPQVQLSNEQTELTWTVPSKHVLRTYNALISASRDICEENCFRSRICICICICICMGHFQIEGQFGVSNLA